MPVQVATNMREVSLRLRATGQVGLKRAMYRSFREAGVPAGEAVRAEERRVLPHRGGLADWVADTPVKVRILTGPRTAGVRLVQAKPGSRKHHDLAALNRGRNRHPVYADQRKTRKQWTWVTQRVPAGWWNRTLRDYGEVVRTRLRVAMAETSKEAGFR